MDVLTRENAIIAISIGVALLALVVYFALDEFTELGDAPRYLILIGVIFPMRLPTGYSS